MKVIDLEQELNYMYYESFISYWLPVYKRQVFKAKFNDDKAALISIKDNIIKNIHLDETMKSYILKQLGLSYLLIKN